ncbi:hypothetical protein M413DRAFT_276320 [Hebeloma cylindrosporum]|uniref:DUF6533 domain-containing protein n=1 Tax=Hebeloma cylindrosporum TaxID=76867 RepID=A0A0C3BYZ8_HEBCY|nr:hypothetical protein M413DRAFT_276320 [Hebeloma cylindrosporum h7]
MTTTVRLYARDFIPLYVVLSALVWVIHDYFLTLEDEVTYFWSRKRSSGTLIFFWIRYYTIFLVVFDTIETHIFPIPAIMTQSLIVGAISLWSIEIIMQLRIYVLFDRSKKVAFVNGFLFLISVAVFLWILISNALHHPPVPPEIIPLPSTVPGNLPPLPGDVCQRSIGGARWAQWVPATLFEFVLFGMAVYKTVFSSAAKTKLNGRWSLTAILLHENIVYFFVRVGCVLLLNNLMVACQTQVPWFGFGPFHASLGIATCRMLIHLRKFASGNLQLEADSRLLPNFEVDLSELSLPP